MGEKQKRGDDASDHAPKASDAEPGRAGAGPLQRSTTQDAANYDNVRDEGRAVPVEDMNSANDE